MIYRIMMTVALLVAAVVLYFFLWGLSDGTVDQANILLWLPLLAFAVGPPIAAAKLRARGQNAAAIVLLLLPALPALLFALFMAVAIGTGARWN